MMPFHPSLLLYMAPISFNYYHLLLHFLCLPCLSLISFTYILPPSFLSCSLVQILSSLPDPEQTLTCPILASAGSQTVQTKPLTCSQESCLPSLILTPTSF